MRYDLTNYDSSLNWYGIQGSISTRASLLSSSLAWDSARLCGCSLVRNSLVTLPTVQP